MLDIDSYYGSREKILCLRISYDDQASFHIGLTPQILRTCKAIHREATPIMYSENLFQFRSREDAEPIFIAQDILDPWCRNLYEQSPELRNYMVPLSLTNSRFTSFLQLIGQQNAASLKRLRFLGLATKSRMKAPVNGWVLKLIVPLLKFHVPHVHQIKICRGLPDWDKFEDGPFQPVNNWDHRSGFLFKPRSWHHRNSHNEVHDDQKLVSQDEHMAMYNAIVVLTQEITWLKQLSCAGFVKNDPTWPKIQELQTLVKNRRSAPKQVDTLGASEDAVEGNCEGQAGLMTRQ